MPEEFVYIDSSEEDQPAVSSPTPRCQHPKARPSSADPLKHYRCPAHSSSADSHIETEYGKMVEQLLSQKITQEAFKQMVANVEDTIVVQNIEKRNTGYRYALEKMAIDQKYQQILDDRASRARVANQKKRRVLEKKQVEEQCRQQEAQLLRYQIQKQQKKHRVVNNLKKHVKRLGFERIYNSHRQIKQELKKQRQAKQNQRVSRVSKQNNQIRELEEQYQAIKEAKRLNKISQSKVIRDFTNNLVEQKKTIEQIIGSQLGKKKTRSDIKA